MGLDIFLVKCVSISLAHFPTGFFFFLLLSFEGSLYILDIILCWICGLQIFFSLCSLYFQTFHRSLVEQKFLILSRSNLPNFLFSIFLLCLRTLYLALDFLLFFSKYFVILHLNLWFKLRSSLSMCVQLLQYHMLKRLFCIHWVAFVPLS